MSPESTKQWRFPAALELARSVHLLHLRVGDNHRNNVRIRTHLGNLANSSPLPPIALFPGIPARLPSDL